MAAQSKSYHVLGTDLALTRYTGAPGSVPLDVADSWGSVDLAAVPGGRVPRARGVLSWSLDGCGLVSRA